MCDGSTLHPNIPAEVRFLLMAFEDDCFMWEQEWVDQYWREVDEVVWVQNVEVKVWRAREKKKRPEEIRVQSRRD